MKLWETIADTLDPNVKGKIFFAMLTGDTDSKVTIFGVTNGASKIACIKVIREYTGIGLLEAKTLYEDIADFKKSVTIKVAPNERRMFVANLSQHGMITS